MILEMFREALLALRANRLRSILTMLGMIIGVGSVIAMLAIGQGVQERVQTSISSMGANLFIVVPGSTSANGVRSSAGSASSLTLEDARALQEVPGASAVAPVVQSSSQVIYGTQNWNTTVLGTTSDYLTVRDWRVRRGYGFDRQEQQAAAQVVLLGAKVAENLFGNADPLGETLRIRNVPFQVIGVLAAKGQSLDGRDQDDTVVIPVTTSQRKLAGNRFRSSVRMIMVQAVSEQAMPDVEIGIKETLRRQHRLSGDAEDDFTVQNLTALANTAAETTAVLSLLLGAIAGISLLVGGIGIMNIMLVSVTERTREIGIRMAIGARPQAIRLQFLLEAVVISLAGCLLGVGLGIAGAYAVAQAADLLVIVTLGSLLLAFTVAAGIGIFFGFYPANRAAALKPIEALRFQ
ncbi:ABC transporter permease [Perlucidibaca piscinae]|uniref:ABC transporter permease n=1 Tax=Perlucidibaca piscinae TaxID=392589 RepID=UPI0003B6FB97|nr:ABC transporter permease [Perlucidibaca piscinae]